MSKYPSLPVMQCEPNCGECCTVAPCKDWEFDRITEYAEKNGVVPVRQGLTCPWFQGGTCAVHQVLPGICRLFGHVKRLECMRGHNVNVTSSLEKAWQTALGKPTRLTHQVFDDWKEILRAELGQDVDRIISIALGKRR